MYFAHGAPHFPLKAPQEVIAKYRGRYKVGWDKLREQTLARQIAELLADLPEARCHQYDPVNRDQARAGAALAFEDLSDTEAVLAALGLA